MEVLTDNGARRTKRVFIETFGCQMNDNDSERILGFLKGVDYARTDKPDKADLIVLNTCSIRDKAEQKVYSMLGRFKDFKMKRPGVVISVGGCVAQQEGERLLKRIPYVDLVFGPHNIHRLPELIRGVEEDHARFAAIEFNGKIDPEEYGTVLTEDGLKASVSIMRGCDNFCAYCIVPYTRGREISRPSSDIINEIVKLAEADIKEVVLLGQNVNSYGKSGSGEVSFHELLRKACLVEGIKRIRFITSHPKDISDDLIRLFGEEEKLCRHIHLPVQSGSDRVLEAMGRGYTREEYLNRVNLLKGLYHDMAITTDIIVGFPGETEEDFSLTMDLLEEVRYDNIFSFMYSPRPGTKAADFPHQVDQDEKSARLRTLQSAQRSITEEKSASLVGKTLSVLVDGKSKQNTDELTGRTSCNRIINFPGPKEFVGETVEVMITTAYPNSLRGSVQQGAE